MRSKEYSYHHHSSSTTRRGLCGLGKPLLYGCGGQKRLQMRFMLINKDANDFVFPVTGTHASNVSSSHIIWAQQVICDSRWMAPLDDGFHT